MRIEHNGARIWEDGRRYDVFISSAELARLDAATAKQITEGSGFVLLRALSNAWVQLEADE